MSLEEIFYLSQSVSSIAVVGSLVYLGLQVRGAERSQRAIMQQGRANRASQIAASIAQPELARVFQRGAAGNADLSPEEFTQWLLICRALFLSGEDSYLQYHAGQLDQASFESYVAGTRFYLGLPGFRAAWQVSAGQFGNEFQDFVNGIIESTPIHPANDKLEEWRRLVSAP
jgi:hypothetical protein